MALTTLCRWRSKQEGGMLLSFTFKNLGRMLTRSMIFGVSMTSAIVALSATSNAQPVAISPYSITTFATDPAGLSNPDSIAFNSTNVFVGYGNGGNPDGSGGATSNVVEYDLTGTSIKTFTITGHNDGLRIDPVTGDL